jgi:hypothetical protein
MCRAALKDGQAWGQETANWLVAEKDEVAGVFRVKWDHKKS